MHTRSVSLKFCIVLIFEASCSFVFALPFPSTLNTTTTKMGGNSQFFKHILQWLVLIKKITKIIKSKYLFHYSLQCQITEIQAASFLGMLIHKKLLPFFVLSLMLVHFPSIQSLFPKCFHLPPSAFAAIR